jgi:hypothetical protein
MLLIHLTDQQLTQRYHLLFRQLKSRITIANAASSQRKESIFDTQATRAGILLKQFNQAEQELLARHLPILSKEDKTILPTRHQSI